jgi:alpha-galactosidase
MSPLATRSISGLALGCLLLLPLRGQAIPPELKGADAPPHTIWLESLDLTKSMQSFGTAQVDKTPDNNPLKLAGVAYPHGVGVNSKARIVIDLHGAATRFESLVGVDDDSSRGSITFSVLVDGKKAQETGVLHGKDQPQLISVDLTGARRLVLIIGDGNDGIEYDHADWAGAQIALVPGATEKPEAIPVPPEVPRMKILTDDPQPAIHGARMIGTTPGRFFLFSISATGTAPLTYSAQGLPAGLTLDGTTGFITGSLQQAGTTVATLTVSGPGGTAHRDLTVVGGDHKLDLTPQMGWNSWNVWGNTVTEAKVKDAANEMISAGLQAHGYQYVNIDQGWQGKRDAQGNIQSNADFPDMKGLSDYVHGKGLRIGIYSSPGPQTCGPYEGSYQHEDQDAQTYAQWGFDYLKYDWCTYEQVVKGDHSVPALQKPYAVMRASLDKVNRDLVYSLCQYGMGNSWTWAADPPVQGNSWRTNGDIMDNWGSLYGIIENEVGHEKYAGPGHWNDPDMLMVGIVGFGNTHPTGLTPNEQLTHISMWCMLSSPLLIGCDMTKFDPFTRAILTNDEALDIDQDPLGKPASRLSKDANLGEVWARELYDGTHAVALLNGGADDQKLTVRFSDLGLSGSQPVRDLWLHQDVDSSEDGYSVVVPTHGIVLLKIGKPKP